MSIVRSYFRALLIPALVASLVGAQPVCAQGDADIDTSTAAVVSLKKSMANRFVLLKSYMEAGVIGLAHDGTVALRNAAALDAKLLPALDAMIAEENKDRATLYREIARANNRPEWEADLRATFGQRWISRMPAGWFYRDDKGQWLKK